MWGYVLIAFFAALRLGELVLSRSNARYLIKQGAHRISQDGMTGLTVLHTTFLAAVLAEYTWRGAYALPLQIAPLIALLAAQALRYWSIGTLGRRWNVQVYVLPGVAPVHRGPYRFLRHPNYLAVAIEMLCLPLCLHTYLTAIVFSVANALVVARRIRVEERALCSETPYESEMAAVPRGVWSLDWRRRP